MKTINLAIIAAILLTAAGLYGQCDTHNCTTQISNASGATGDWSTVVVDLRAGQYVRFQVVAGVTYEWSTCGELSPGFDTEITIKSSAGGTYACSEKATAVADIDPATDIFTSTAHGLGNDTEGYFAATELPVGVTAATNYYVVNRTADTFQVAATPDGPPIDISSVGAAVVFYSKTLSGTSVAGGYNDNDTGCAYPTMSTVSWTAPTDGTVAVLVNESTCTTNDMPFSYVDLKWRIACRGCTGPALSGDPLQSSSSSQWSTVATDLKGGQHVSFDLVAGTPYTWTTCLADPNDPDKPTFDTELSLFGGAVTCSGAPLTLNGRILAYDDDDTACEHGMSTLSWTPSADTTVAVLVTEKDATGICRTNGETDSNVSLRWRVNGCRNCTTTPDPAVFLEDAIPEWTSSDATVDVRGGVQPFLYHVVKGTQYEWRTNTNSPWVSFNTEITVIKNEGGYTCTGGAIGGTIVAYNDDDSTETDGRSIARWTADFTGIVAVLVTERYCAEHDVADTGVFLEWRTLPIVATPCALCTSTDPVVAVGSVTLSDVFQPVANNLKAGDFVTFPVTPTQYYQWTTCGSPDPTFGTTLTLFFQYDEGYACSFTTNPAVGVLSGSPLAFNNDGAYEPPDLSCANGLSTMGWWVNPALTSKNPHTVAVLVNESVCRAHDGVFPPSGVTLSWRTIDPPEQCDNCSRLYPVSINKNPATKPDWSPVTAYMRGGDYAFFEVEESYVYEWSTCETNLSGDYFDTQLTLRRDTCNGTLLSYNNDNATEGTYCDGNPQRSKFSTVQWYAPFTGTVAILLSEKYCQNNYFPATTLKWRRYSASADCVTCIEDDPATTLVVEGYAGSYPAPVNIGDVNLISNISDGYFARITNVVANATYEFTTCGTGGAATIDTQLTLRGAAALTDPNCSSPLLAYNDNGDVETLPVVADKDAFTFTSSVFHWLQNGTRVRFSAATLPVGIAEDTDYYIIQRTDTAFKVAATPASGTPVAFSTVGTDVLAKVICGQRSRVIWTVPADLNGKTVSISMHDFPCIKSGLKNAPVRVKKLKGLRFTDNLDPAGTGDTVINDNTTGLFWWVPPAPLVLDWQGALDHCATTLNSGSGYAGYKTWRLPTVNDLVSIIDFNLQNPATSMPRITTPAEEKQHWAWSSTTYIFGDPGENSGASYHFAWTANLQDGRTYAEVKEPYLYEETTDDALVPDDDQIVAPSKTPVTLCVRDTSVIGVHRNFAAGGTNADPYLTGEQAPVVGWACDKSYYSDRANLGKPLPHLYGYVEVWTSPYTLPVEPYTFYPSQKIWTSPVDFLIDDTSDNAEAANNCGLAPTGTGYNFSYDLTAYVEGATGIYRRLQEELDDNIGLGRRPVWPLLVYAYAVPLDGNGVPQHSDIGHTNGVKLWLSPRGVYFFGNKPLCGDGYKQFGEACEDGNSSNKDGCVTLPDDPYTGVCTNASCGDGYIGTYGAVVEVCDKPTCAYPSSSYQTQCPGASDVECASDCQSLSNCDWHCCNDQEKNGCTTSCKIYPDCSNTCSVHFDKVSQTKSCTPTCGERTCNIVVGQTTCRAECPVAGIGYYKATCDIAYDKEYKTDTCPTSCPTGTRSCIPKTQADCQYGVGLTAPEVSGKCDQPNSGTIYAEKTNSCTPPTRQAECSATCWATNPSCTPTVTTPCPAKCTPTCDSGGPTRSETSECTPGNLTGTATYTCSKTLTGDDRPEECDGGEGGSSEPEDCHELNAKYYDRIVTADCDASCRIATTTNLDTICPWCGNDIWEKDYTIATVPGREVCDPTVPDSMLCVNLYHPTISSFLETGTSVANCNTCNPTEEDIRENCRWCGDNRFTDISPEMCDPTVTEDQNVYGGPKIKCSVWGAKYGFVYYDDLLLECPDNCTPYTADGTIGGTPPADHCHYCGDGVYTSGKETCETQPLAVGDPDNMPPYIGKDCGDYGATNLTDPAAFPYWPSTPPGYLNLAACDACAGYDYTTCDYCGDGDINGPETCELYDSVRCVDITPNPGYYATNEGVTGDHSETITHCNNSADANRHCKEWCVGDPVVTGCAAQDLCPYCGDGLYTSRAETCDPSSPITGIGGGVITCATYWANRGNVPLDSITMTAGWLPEFYPYGDTLVECRTGCMDHYTQRTLCRFCGDGLTQDDATGNEECDPSDTSNTHYCKELDETNPPIPNPKVFYPLFTVGCAPDCTLQDPDDPSFTGCPRCGDGKYTPDYSGAGHPEISLEKCDHLATDGFDSFGSREIYCTLWCSEDEDATLRNCYDYPGALQRTVTCSETPQDCSRYEQSSDAAKKCFGCGDGKNLLYNSDLVMALHFEEPSGTTLYDAAPGTAANAVPASGAFSGIWLNQSGRRTQGKAIAFTHSNNLRIPDAAKLDISGDMTFAFWFKQSAFYTPPIAGAPYPILVKGHGWASNYGFWMHNDGSGNNVIKFSFHSAETTGCGITTTAQDWTGWTHVAAVRSGTQLTMYVNGAQVNQLTCGTIVPPVNNDPITIGEDTSHPMHSSIYYAPTGYMDELFLYKRALTQPEIAFLVNRGAVTPAEYEYCDDGDVQSGDGCSSNCQIETGYVCTGSPSVCTVPSGITCLSGWTLNPSNNRCYKYFSTSRIFTAAEADCVTQSAHLASMSDASENSFVRASVVDPVVSGAQYWIGLRQAETEVGTVETYNAGSVYNKIYCGTTATTLGETYVYNDTVFTWIAPTTDYYTFRVGTTTSTFDLQLCYYDAYYGSYYCADSYGPGGAETLSYQYMYAGYSHKIYVGGYDSADAGQFCLDIIYPYTSEVPWTWTDGSSYVYGNWGASQPDNAAGVQNCTQVTSGAGVTTWDDLYCGTSIPYVCEKGSGPSTCGDGVQTPDEECDNGIANGPCGTCTSACKNQAITPCGDGTLCPGETCEDGLPGQPSDWATGTDAYDGCFQGCVAGYHPLGLHRAASTAADGINGWACDPDDWDQPVTVYVELRYTNQNTSETCADGDPLSPPPGCTVTVQSYLDNFPVNRISSNEVIAACGGLADGGNIHDFALSVGDFSSSTLTVARSPYWAKVYAIEPAAPAGSRLKPLNDTPIHINICGDGIVAGGEECDEGSAGFSDECDGCTSDCKIIPAYSCGDGVVCTNHGVIEECDDGLVNNSYDKPCAENCKLNPCDYGNSWFFNVDTARCYKMTPGGSAQDFYGALNVCQNATNRANLVSMNSAAEESWLRGVFPTMATGYTVIGGSEVWDTYQRAATDIWVEEVWAYPETSRVYFGSLSGRANNFTNAAGPDVRYTWRVPTDGTYRINLIPNSSFNAVLSVYNYQTFAWTHYNANGAGAGPAYMETTGDMTGLVAGQTYEFIVDSTAAGTYILEILRNNAQPAGGYTTWSDGSAFSYTNWLPGHPTFASNIYRWTTANNLTTPTWNDGGLGPYQYLCEKPGYKVSPGAYPSVCGDGYQTGTEGCDDGNLTAGDGCNASCAVEAGWSCSANYRPSRCSRCGDSTRQWHEQCDDGNANANDGCVNCAIESADWHCTGLGGANQCRRCGNGTVELNEFCDANVACASLPAPYGPIGNTGTALCTGCLSWTVIDQCKNVNPCGPAPAGAWYYGNVTTYNYTQTWKGTNWDHAITTPTHSATENPTQYTCEYRCQDNYTWTDGTYCKQNTKRAPCPARPRENPYTVWNDGLSGADAGTFVQTWDGDSWEPATKSTIHDDNVGECHYKCDVANSAVWDAGLGQCRICGDNNQEGTESCDNSDLDGKTCWDMGIGANSSNSTGNTLSCNADCTFKTNACTRNYTCSGKPVGTLYYSNNSPTYIYLQTWTGSAWSPADGANAYVAGAPAINTCQYTCNAGAGYVHNGSSCSKCGDTYWTAGEPCDDSPDTDNYDACKNDCTVNVCNDGYKDFTDETCDPTDPIAANSSTSCNNALGLSGITGTVQCNSNCNGWVTTPNKCTKTYPCSGKPDVGALYANNGDTYTYTQTWTGAGWDYVDDPTPTYAASPALGTCDYKCAAGYTLDGTVCSRCGDGQITGSEECDNGDNAVVGAWNIARKCNTNCKWNPYCGDTVVAGSPNEECDTGTANLGVDKACYADCRKNPCGDGWIHWPSTQANANNKCYKRGDAVANYAAAKTACSVASATLATVNNSYENAAIASAITTNSWIGLSDQAGTITDAGGAHYIWTPVTMGKYGGRYSGTNAVTGPYTTIGDATSLLPAYNTYHPVWFKIVPAVTGTYAFSATPASTWDSYLHLKDGAGANLTTVNNAASNGGTDYFTYSLTAGQVYYFVVRSTTTTLFGTFTAQVNYMGSGTNIGKKGWESLERYSYANWNTGEPNESGGSEGCTVIQTGGGTWNDLSCATASQGYVCEKQASVTTWAFPTAASLLPTSLPQQKVYVATSGNNTTGTSWATAFTTLQRGMDEADAWLDLGAASVYVRVKGTGTAYSPTSNGAGYFRHFQLRNNVTVDGGFAGTDDTTPSGITYLQGYASGACGTYQVFSHQGIRPRNGATLDATAVLQNVTIRYGYAYPAPASCGTLTNIWAVVPTGANPVQYWPYDRGPAIFNYLATPTHTTGVTVSGTYSCTTTIDPKCTGALYQW